MKVTAIVDGRVFELVPVSRAEYVNYRENVVGVPCIYVAGTRPPEVWPQPQEGIEIAIEED